MSEEIYIPKAGDLVEYVGEKEDGTKVLPVINVLYVSADETKTDPYGRQIERASSVQHVAGTTAKGRFWRPVQINVI
jgi:DNA-binding protein